MANLDLKEYKIFVKGEINKTFSDLVYIFRDGKIPTPKQINDLYIHLIKRIQ